MKLSLLQKILLFFSTLFIAIVIFIFLFYFLILPKIIESNFAINYIQKIVNNNLKMDLIIKNPELNVDFEPEIEFKIEKFLLTKQNQTLIDLDKFNIEIELDKIFKKKIKLDKLSADNLILNLDKLLPLLPQNNSSKEAKPINWLIDFNNSDLKLNNLNIKYLQNNSILNANIKNIKIDDNKMSFVLNADLNDNKNSLNIKTQSVDSIELIDNKININNLNVFINESSLILNSKISSNEILINSKSKEFYLKDIFNIINSNFIIPNGLTMLAPLNNPKGSMVFDINLDLLKMNLTGDIDINNVSATIKDVAQIPIKIKKGKIKISKDKINFIDLVGFYGKNKNNEIKISGNIKDYYKTFESDILIESVLGNEFFKDYLSKLINGTILYVSEYSPTKIIYKSKNNIIDIIWFAQISKGVNFGVTDEKSALSNYDRAVIGEFNINKDNFEIKNLNYYIASNIVRGVKLQPILNANAKMNFSGKIDKAGIAFGREMPCEFLNIFAGNKIFKKGTIKGKIDVVFKNNIPYLDADVEIKKTLIPSQRLAIKEATLKTEGNLININTQGKFKRASYNFVGKIKNGLTPPFVIKKLALDLDNIDVEKFINSINHQPSTNSETTDDEIIDDNYIFDTNLVHIEDCNLKLANGKYKDLTFGNIDAKLTLNKKGILNVQSNRFNIAQGVSSLKFIADLKELKYYLRLGVKEIDSNLMAKTLFNLDKEITGLASGLIELTGDKTLKMNGDVRFLINDGTIGKIGLVEYLMKIASVFRNPVVMVSPVTIIDIISIPEGKFDKIEGVIKIKDNVLSYINIKSYSKSLSALIRGRFDMERHDASMRIYTRFSTDKKSMFGILRSLSLNKLANKIKTGSRNDANYYESELVDLPQIEVDEAKTQIFLTQIEGDIETFNFISSLKKIK